MFGINSKPRQARYKEFFMNISAISTGASQVQADQVQAGAAVKVAAMGLDSMRQQGQDVSKMIQSSVVSDPTKGQNLNILV